MMQVVRHHRGAGRVARCGLVAAVVTIFGCTFGESRPTGPPTGGQIARVVTLMSSHPVNWDDDPAYDGLSLFVLFFRAGRVEAIAVTGTVTFVLYAGAKREPGAKPIHQWTYTPEQLKGHLGKSPYGWGYGFRLDWGDDVPQASAIILVAELRTTDGQVRRSRDVVVRMGTRS